MKLLFLKNLIALLVFSVLFTTCNPSKGGGQKEQMAETTDSPQECIKSIIALDDSLGKIRNHACEQISLAQTIQEYTSGMDQFDHQNCPSDFTTAFKKHREAWVSMIPIVEKYPELRGEMHDLFDQLESEKDSSEFKTRLAAIWTTWEEVETAMKSVPD